jgi:hypothetical protein
MMSAGGARVRVYFADGDGGGSAGRGAVGGGASGTVRLTARRRLHKVSEDVRLEVLEPLTVVERLRSDCHFLVSQKDC